MADRRNRNYSGVFFLLMQLYNIGAEFIPPVTLFLITSQVFIYLDIFNIFPAPSDGCSSVMSVFFNKNYKRLFISQLLHADDWHLYYNGVSFLGSAIQIETKMKSIPFAVMTVILFFLTAFIKLFLLYAMFFITTNTDYLFQCSVGFSGVIFAVKMVACFKGTSVFTNPYTLFFEVLILQFLPNTCLYGHLAGLIAGYLYAQDIFKFIEIPLTNFSNYVVLQLEPLLTSDDDIS